MGNSDGGMDEKIERIEKDIQYFDKMVNGAERLIRPWRLALIVTNVLWAIVFTAFIVFAYLNPAEINVQQKQGAIEQKQEQNIKGAN